MKAWFASSWDSDLGYSVRGSPLALAAAVVALGGMVGVTLKGRMNVTLFHR